MYLFDDRRNLTNVAFLSKTLFVLLSIELTCYREEISEDVAGDVTEKNKSKKGDVKEDLGGKFLDMYSSIYTMRQDLDRIRKPVGTREHPVRTCKDLFYGHPQFKDGEQSAVQNLGTYQIFHINK